MRLFLDSCLVIYLVEQIEPWRTRVEAALRAARFERLVISELVRMECLVGPFKTGDVRVEHAFLTFFEGCEMAPILPSTFDLAAHIRADYGLKTPDALHLAVAVESRCDELWTNDDRFARAATNIVIRAIV